jgi:hypothetical protein
MLSISYKQSIPPAEYCYAECHSAECRGADIVTRDQSRYTFKQIGPWVGLLSPESRTP